MCRLLAYLGPAVRLDELLFAHPHSLYVQSYQPREMLSGTVNVDGFGVGFYLPDDPDPAPGRYVSTAPLWADPNIASLGRKLRARCVLAAVRGATPGMPHGADNVAPFVAGPYLFAHNGLLADFRRTLMRPIRARLSAETEATIAGGTDSEHLFALVRERLAGARPGAGLAGAVRGAVAEVAALAREHGVEALLNVVITDGFSIVATRAGTSGRAPSLYVLEAARGTSDAAYVASEPLFPDARWRAVPLDTLVTVGSNGAAEVAAL